MVMKQVFRHPIATLTTILSDPIDSAFQVRERVVDRLSHVPLSAYRPDSDWEMRLTTKLDLPADNMFEPLWTQVVASLQQRGLGVGPNSFYGWNDGDAGLVRAIWRVVRHLRPQHVVETGVAHGVTSRFVLEALQLNGSGRLWSIDLPPFNPEKRKEVGIAVTDAQRQRWRYIGGTSRNKLPKLLAELKSVDVFIHDSSHSNQNVMFELETVWPFLRPGGVIFVDDIDISPAFGRFNARHPDHVSLICEAEPLTPDERRFNQKGLFGIICRNSEATNGATAARSGGVG